MSYFPISQKVVQTSVFRLFLICLTLNVSTAFSAAISSEKDSLQRLLETGKLSALQEIEIQTKLIEAFMDADYDSSKFYSEQVLKSAATLSSIKLTSAERKKLNDQICTAIHAIGMAHFEQSNMPAALTYFNEGLNFCRSNNYEEGKAQFLDELGFIQLHEDNASKALDYFQEALDLAILYKDSLGIAKYMSSVAVYYNNHGVPGCKLSAAECQEEGANKAMEYYKKSLEICLLLKDETGIAQMYNNMAYVYRNKGELEAAEENYMKSLAIRTEMGDSSAMVYSYVNIGTFYYRIDKTALAKEYAEKAYTLAERIAIPARIRDAAQLKVKIALDVDNYEDAFNYYQIYLVMYDSVQNIENQKLAIEQELKYSYENQKKLDQLAYQQNIALEQKRKEKQQIVLYAVMVILILVGLFSFFIFNRLKMTQKQKELIESQNFIVNRAKLELETKNKEIFDSINYAQRIQKAILPSAKRIDELFQRTIFVYYLPKDIVAGDFYWMEQTESGTLLAVADCTGHGVPGAMVSVVCNNALNRAVREYGFVEPNLILDKTREIVVNEFEKSEEDVKDGMDISLCKISGRKLTWAGANIPLWIIRNNELIEILPNKQPIGKYEYAVPFTNQEFILESGDHLYLFSDGYVDQFGGSFNKKFKKSNLVKLLISVQDKDIMTQKLIIESNMKDWIGQLEQIDDICIIGLRIS